MKFVFSGDWHLSGYNQDRKDPESQLSERLNNLKNTMYDMIGYCKDNDIDTVVVGGDILHNKSIIHTIAQSVLLQFIRDNKDIKFIITDGNHDLDGKGENVVSGLMSIDNEPNVQRIGTESEYYKDEDNDILFVPYSSKMVDIIKKNSAKYLVSHFGLNEGILNSGQSFTSDLSIKDLTGKYKIVLLGHYHTPQEIIRDNIRVYYSGSLIQLNWNDKNEEKRFLVVDIENDSIESVPTKGYKKFIELVITDDNKSDIINQARKYKEDGHNVNIRKNVEVDTKEIQDEFMIIDRTEKDITNRGINTSMSELEIIDKYLEIKDVDDIDKEKYRNKAIEIISSNVV